MEFRLRPMELPEGKARPVAWWEVFVPQGSQGPIDGLRFRGQVIEIDPMKTIRFKLGDERVVTATFAESGGGQVVVEETFEADNEHAAEQQRQGW